MSNKYYTLSLVKNQLSSFATKHEHERIVFVKLATRLRWEISHVGFTR